ncbi:MAG: hypothetical protein QM751_02485 [Paludibacteraceae bacterium]
MKPEAITDIAAKLIEILHPRRKVKADNFHTPKVLETIKVKASNFHTLKVFETIKVKADNFHTPKVFENQKGEGE